MKRLIYLLLIFIAMTSCSVIYEYEGDCDPKYRVVFRYDYNMKYADAFAHEVTSVSLFAFDANGKLVFQKTDQGSQLGSGDYSMEVDMEPGTYDLVAWCGLEDGKSFSVPVIQRGLTTKSELTCKTNGKDVSGVTVVDYQLKPLYHGSLNSVVFPDEEGVHIVTIPLVKNTNSIRVILQHISGKPVNPDDFTYHITDDNGLLAWDNEIVPNNIVNYEAYYTATGKEVLSKSDTLTAGAAAVAEFATSRLMASSNARMTIKNTKGKTVLSIPLIEFLLLVKSNYNSPMTDQEYLDRQDEYHFIFFLQDKKADGSTGPDEGTDPDDPDGEYTWMNAYIYIGAWKVVLSSIIL